MTAAQYLTDTPLRLKPQLPKVEREIHEHHKVNFVIITILSREISDHLYGWGKRGIISYKGHNFFEKASDRDYDNLNQLMLEVKNEEIDNEHYNGIVLPFQEMAKRTLSDFQKQSNPDLEKYLKIIYAIKFIENNMLSVSLSQGYFTNKKIMNFIKDKREEIEKVFLKEYKVISNSRTFNFDQFKSLFNRIKTMNWDSYKKFLDEFITE